MEEIKLQSKSARGGRREGAGRKPHKMKGLLKQLPPDSAALILADMDANKKWRDLADSKDERIVLETLKYLTDRAYGKAKQVIAGDPESPLMVKHEFDPTRLSNEQLVQLEQLIESAYAGSNQG